MARRSRLYLRLMTSVCRRGAAEWRTTAGKQPCSVGAGAPGFGPDARLRGWGGCARSGEKDVSPRRCFVARLVWLPAGRSPGSGGARPAGCSRAPGGACTCVRTVGRCRACARHGRDARQSRPGVPRNRGPAPPGEKKAQNPGPGNPADAQGRICALRFSVLTLSRCTKTQGRKMRGSPWTPGGARDLGTLPRPSQQSARPLARTPARSPSVLGNHSAGGY